MPFQDIYGELEGVEEGLVLDITSRKFAPLVMDLLPYGHAWDREDPILRQLVTAESIELSRVDVQARALERELDPGQTFELLIDWETSYGLPECALPDTIEGRRLALAAKLLAQGGHDQSFGYWDSLVAKLGYDLHFVGLGPDILTCIDDCIDVVTDEAFMWHLAVNPGEDDGLLECLVDNNAPLISFPIVHYLWTMQTIDGAWSFRGIASNSKGYSVVVGLGGHGYTSGADITVWTPVVSGLGTNDVRAVCAVDDIFVAVGAPLLDGIYSLDHGKNWQPSVGFAGAQLNGIARGPGIDQVVVAVGDGGQIWRSTNAGVVWASIASPTAAALYCITSCKGAMVVGGAGGVLVRSTFNGGAPWSIIPIPGLAAAIRGIAGQGSTVVLVGDGGRIYLSGDSGATWKQRPSPVASDLFAVAASPSGRWTACGAGGVILQSLDDGLSWELQDSQGVTADLYAACGHVPDGFALVAGNLSTLITE